MVHHGERIALIALLAQLCFLQESARCEEGFIFLDARITGNCRPRIIDRSLLVVVHGDPRPGIDLDSGAVPSELSEFSSTARASFDGIVTRQERVDVQPVRALPGSVSQGIAPARNRYRNIFPPV